MLVVSGCVEETIPEANTTDVNETVAQVIPTEITLNDTTETIVNDTQPTKKVISLEDAKEQTAAGLGGMGGGSGGGGGHHHSSDDSDELASVETPAEIPTETPIDTTAEEIIVETPVETPEEVPTETPIETPIEEPSETEVETPIEIPYQTDGQLGEYDYCLRGENDRLLYVVYGGLNDYLNSLPDEIYYYDTPPEDIDFVMRDLDEPNQKLSLDPLVSEIQNLTPNKDDQARIAISLVQHIPYDWNSAYVSHDVTNKYPYETLYTDIGVCGQKSELLAYLLRGLGYGVVLFDFENESVNHEAVGIKCPIEYSYDNTGYAFVESTRPTIITDDDNEYFVGDGTTTMPLPQEYTMLTICDGISFESIDEEYYDNIEYDRAYEAMNSYPDRPLNEEEYAAWEAEHNKWQSIVNKYDIEIETEE